MSRVIQDSEDEFDEEDLEAPLLPSPTRNALPEIQRQTPIPSREQGTGSTDSLRRNIEAAHRSHFQIDASNVLPAAHSTHDSSTSFPEHPSKRRKTSADVPPGMSSGRLAPMEESFGMSSARKKPVKTYSRSKSVLSSPLFERNLAAAGPQQSPTRVAELVDHAWIAGTMREDYAQHEPLAMFPEPSSTVPNATLTQQRMLEQARAPLILSAGIPDDPAQYLPQDDSVPYQPAKSSIPWSEYLRTPSGNTEPTGSRQDTSHPVSQLPDPSDDDAQIQYELVSSNHPRRDTEVRVVIESPSIARRKTNERTSSPSPKPARRSSPQPTSDDELAAIGVPKEQYKPRPSRSRSIKAPEDQSIDVSVRPEKAGRRSTKRTNVTGSVESSLRSSTPLKVQQMVEMGFTPTTTEKALLQSDGDMSKAVDWLIANSVSVDQHDELAHAHVAKPPLEDIVVSSSLKSKPSPQKIDPITSSQARKAKRRKTTLDVPEPTVEPNEAPAPITSSKEKRRGRGRPRKDAKALEAVAEMSEIKEPELAPSLEDIDQARSNTHDSREAESTSKQMKDDAMEKTLPPQLSATDMQVSIEGKDEAGRVLPSTTEAPASTPPGVKTAVPAEATNTPERKTKPSTGSHSPLNKGKVPYRVGLSKRARIAPLLRVVKK